MKRLGKNRELPQDYYDKSVIFIALFGVMLSMFSCSQPDRPASRMVSMAPAGARLFAGGKSARVLLSELDSLQLPAGLRRDLALFRAVLTGDNPGNRLGALLLFLEPNGPEGPAFGAIVEREGSNDLLLQGRPPDGATRYRGAEILSFTLPDSSGLYAATEGKYLVVGRFAFLVESVVGQIRGRGDTRGRPSALEQFTGMNQTAWAAVEPGMPLLPAGWLRCGISRDDSGTLRVQGIFRPDNPEEVAWLEETSFGRPQTILTVLPESLSWWQWRRVIPGKAAWPRGNNDPLREALAALAEPEEVYAGMNLPGRSEPDSRFWVLPVTDPSAAEQQLDHLGKTTGLLDDIRYQTYRIQQFLTGDFYPSFPGATPWANPYVVVLGNFVVVADSRSGLEWWIDQYLVGATLASSRDFLAFYAANDASARSWWVARPEILTYGRTWKEPWATLFQNLNRRSWVGICWGDQKQGGVTWTSNLPPSPPRTPEVPQLVWRIPLEAPLLQGPFFLPLPPPLGPRLVVQDQQYRLKFLDTGGNVQMVVPLDGPLLSSVYTIDYYRDGQRQVLLNTPDAIHVLDAPTGKPVGNFPIRLQSPAVTGLTLADFAGQGGDAIFVTCANGNSYGYDTQGEPLPGWSPRAGVGRIEHPFLHFQYDFQDFLVGLNTEGVLWAFGRDGTMRFPGLTFSDTFPSPPAYDLQAGAERIVACDQSGVARIVGLKGDYFPLRLEERPVRPVRFAFADVAGDARADYLTLSGRRLTVHYYARKTLRKGFTCTFDGRPDELFAVPRQGAGKAWIGVVDSAAHQIYLVDPQGRIPPGFPLAGNRRFLVADLFGEGAEALIVADGAYLYAYRLPYDSLTIE